MKIQPLESSIMLAGLTRGLWMGTTADRYPRHRVTWANAAGWPSPPPSDVKTLDFTREDCASGPADVTSDRD